MLSCYHYTRGDGPIADLLRAGGRYARHPAHFHFIVGAAGFRPLTAEVFADNPYTSTATRFSA